MVTNVSSGTSPTRWSARRYGVVLPQFHASGARQDTTTALGHSETSNSPRSMCPTNPAPSVGPLPTYASATGSGSGGVDDSPFASAIAANLNLNSTSLPSLKPTPVAWRMSLDGRHVSGFRRRPASAVAVLSMVVESKCETGIGGVNQGPNTSECGLVGLHGIDDGLDVGRDGVDADRVDGALDGQFSYQRACGG